MIYNLYKYITTNSSLSPLINGFDAGSADDAIMIMLTGGFDKPVIGTGEYTVQAMARGVDRVKPYQQLTELYNLLQNRFRLTLPTITVNSIIYPEITASAIISIQSPSYIGSDESNRHLWTVNFKITI